MKVILKEYVYKHGVAGDVVDVANGFARNYLLPRGLAVRATERAMQENAKLMAEATIRRNELNEKLVAVANQVEDTHLVFGRKAGSNGKLYGSVTTMDITQGLLEETGIDINRRRISENALRELGTHEVTIRMGQDLSPKIKVTIVREEDLAEFLEQSEEATPEEIAEELLDEETIGEEGAAEGEEEAVEAEEETAQAESDEALAEETE